MRQTMKLLAALAVLFASIAAPRLFAGPGDVELDAGEVREPAGMPPPVAREEERKDDADRWYEVTGTVGNIDRQNGLFDLATEHEGFGFRKDESTLRLHLPTELVRTLDEGEKITAMLAFQRGAPAERLVRAYDAPIPGKDPALGRHSIGGTVESIDPEKNTFNLKTESGVLTLRFPEEQMRELHVGDRITAEIAFRHEPTREKQERREPRDG